MFCHKFTRNKLTKYLTVPMIKDTVKEGKNIPTVSRSSLSCLFRPISAVNPVFGSLQQLPNQNLFPKLQLFHTSTPINSKSPKNHYDFNLKMSNIPATLEGNPFLTNWSAHYGMPPFDAIKADHFEPALNYAMEEHLKEIRSLVENSETPSFENTIVQLDRVGGLFSRVSATFDNLCSSLGVPELQAVKDKMAGPLAAHENKVATYPGLFQKIDQVHSARNDAGLNSEQIRLVERYHLDFLRAGAKFTPEMQARYAKIVEELAELSTKFSQNVTLDVNEIYLELKSAEDKTGLPEDLVSAARQAAAERNITDENTSIITLSRSLVEPFLTFSDRRDLREKAWRLWSRRGELTEGRDNLALARRILVLRAEKAKMHGYSTFAAYSTADSMASNPDRVLELLENVWSKAKVSVNSERQELENFMKTTGNAQSEIEPWDWRYYAEKVRLANYNLDASAVKPYFPLNRMIEAIFDVAYRLFRLKFVENTAAPRYHPDIKIYEVFRELDSTTGEKELIALFISDNYARPFKRGGAWMSSFRTQHRNTPDGSKVIPIIINNNNFNKGSDPVDSSKDTLLSFDDATTLFHEFGHGLHGMLSNVTYERLAGTSVLHDFVELPSQLYEHWLSEKEVLTTHAKHYQTNEVIPEELLNRLMKAKKFNQGFATVEYTASALVDAKLHKVVDDLEELDLREFEKKTLDELGMPQGIIMRHRLPHFERKLSGQC
jgi:peptidyl-dipeptidase Dcp